MKDYCCICGKKVKFGILGDTGVKLSNGVACFACNKLAGNGKGFFSKMGLSATSVKEFTDAYYSSPKVKKKMLAEKKKQIAAQKKEAKSYASVDITNMSFSQLVEEIKKFEVPNPGIILRPEEVCYFSSSCSSAKFKQVVVGSTRTSGRIGSGRKGLFSGYGFSEQVNNRGIVSEQYPGNFYLTSKRLICAAVKYSFEIPVTAITSLTVYEDGLSVMSSGETYNVLFQNVERFKRVIAINNEIQKKKPNVETEVDKEKKVSSVKESDIPKLLREYKTLLDDGIISEEEFNRKKEQLLSGQKST